MGAIVTLDEVNRQVRDRIYTILNAISPREWDKESRVFLLAEDDKEYAFQYYQEIADVTSVSYPICSITRELNFEDEGDNSHQPNKYNKIVSNDGQARVIPIKTNYQISIYHHSFKICEEIIESIIFIRNEIQSLTYNSKIISDNDLYYVNMLFSELPSYTMIPSKEDRDRGHGFIYKLNIPVRVESYLMKPIADIKRILTIITDVYPNKQSEATEDNKETYIINAG